MSDDVGRKILLIGNYPPPFGGISVHLQGLADKLSLEKEWDVTRLDIEPGSRRKEQVLRAPGSLRLIGRIAVQIYRCDMVHFQTNGHNWKSCLLIVFICLYASLWRKGAVLTLHSGNCPVYVSGLSSVMRSLFLRILQRYDRIVAVNSTIFSYLQDCGLYNVECIPAYLGLRCSPQPPKSAALAEFITTHTPIWTSILAYRPEYGLQTIAQLCRLARGKYPRFGIILIGPLSGGDDWLRELKKEGIADHLYPAGELPAAEVYSVLQQGDIFLRTTRFDGDAISVREALSLNVPVIASATDFRPSGVWKYREGDAEDLLRQIEAVNADILNREREEIVREDFYHQLTMLYRTIAESDRLLNIKK